VVGQRQAELAVHLTLDCWVCVLDGLPHVVEGSDQALYVGVAERVLGNHVIT
jgi:hypothetical protein